MSKLLNIVMLNVTLLIILFNSVSYEFFSKNDPK